MTKQKGGEVIVDYLIKQKVPYVFGICGHGNVGILDALHERKDEIQYVSPRHEQCAGHMADGYFRVRHAPVATLTSTGPGSANMVMSLATALSDSSAFLAITANVPTSQANRAPFQELYKHNQADFAQVLRPVVKRSFQPSRVDMLPLALRQSFDTMLTGRPGPVNMDVPYNVFQEEDVVEDISAASRTLGRHRPAVSESDLAAALSLLTASQRPVFFIGQGATLSEAGPALSKLQAQLGIPVITSPNGMGCVPADDPLTLGFIGRNGAYPANQAGRHADLVICVGTRFDDRSSSTWMPGYSWNFPGTKLLHVDLDPAELGRNYPPTLGLIADAKTFCEQLLGGVASHGTLKRENFSAWRAQIADWQQEWNDFIAPNFGAITTPIRPEYVVGTLQKVLPEDVILTLDSGVHHNWFMQFWRPQRPASMLNSWGYSSMGFGVCSVLGAQLAAPERPCVAVVGDGGFMMTPYVVATAVEYQLPCIWIVWNNFAWGAIRDLQYGLFDGRELGTAFYKGDQGPGGQRYNPDFAAWARACGADGVTITRSADLAPAVEQALRNRRPCVIDVHIDAEVRPPSTGTWQLPPIPYTEPAFGKPWIA
ncbi:thiamine pyrophosphate-binding protein [Castellaniella sp. S9]|uniref:thiamine pyrophosphate-binding protein n=1 Tax=Castellaniella sp. S9 TaxID=2993652 RepID=UPI0022B4572A|nr:thiamine pyrophosphate-binding protein [Castellaniella sp. S9]